VGTLVLAKMSAGIEKAIDRYGVRRGAIIFESRNAPGCGEADYIKRFLHANWETVQGTPGFLSPDRRVGCPRASSGAIEIIYDDSV
jgi:hypothetical protein